jgi:hypothetical protein
MLYDDAQRDTFEVPKGAERKARDKGPYAPLQVRREIIVAGIGVGDGTLSRPGRSMLFYGLVDAWPMTNGGPHCASDRSTPFTLKGTNAVVELDRTLTKKDVGLARTDLIASVRWHNDAGVSCIC